MGAEVNPFCTLVILRASVTFELILYMYVSSEAILVMS